MVSQHDGRLHTTLHHEVAMYQHMQPLQGEYIPELVDRGYIKDTNLFFLATKLQEGDLSTAPLELLSDIRKSALAAMDRFQEFKVAHNSIKGVNFVYTKTGKAMVIDFHRSTWPACEATLKSERYDADIMLQRLQLVAKTVVSVLQRLPAAAGGSRQAQWQK
ncbi:hypothetical protein WJX72_002718 [[Myrmecia] bisecta]|uniref:Protein kinase domain-containing protein n=1 Tax=[Myrmecia] bisecta TaxID=41462 RepID=A0AAW1QPL3_9CHLO